MSRIIILFILSAFIAVSLGLPILYTDDGNETCPDPYIGKPSYDFIFANPNPCIADSTCELKVIVGNSGDKLSICRVKLSYNQWGIIFGNWTEVGTTDFIHIKYDEYEAATLDHVFENKDHMCLKAEVLPHPMNTLDYNSDMTVRKEVHPLQIGQILSPCSTWTISDWLATRIE